MTEADTIKGAEDVVVDTSLTQEEDRTARAMVVSSQEYAEVKARNLAFMDPVRWVTMQKMAQAFVQAGALPSTMSAPKVVMALQAGFEAGLKPIEAINSFYFVNGKIAMYGEAVIRQVIRAGHKVTWGIYLAPDGSEVKAPCDEKQASVTIERKDTKERMGALFTIKQAQERGFLSKDTWKKYPENMLKFRAFSMVAKFITPDALMGLQIGEELEGEIINADGTRESVKASYTAQPVRASHKPLADVLAEPEPEPVKDTEGKSEKKPSKKGEDADISMAADGSLGL